MLLTNEGAEELHGKQAVRLHPKVCTAPASCCLNVVVRSLRPPKWWAEMEGPLAQLLNL